MFFVWIGLQTDPLAVGPVLGPILVAALLTGPAKLVTGYPGGQRSDLSTKRSLRVGFALVTRGEFSLIVAAAALAAAGGALPALVAPD